MDSPEFLRTATWTPLDPTLRTWEKSVTASYTSPTPREESRDSMGAALPLSSEKLSGVLDPKVNLIQLAIIPLFDFASPFTFADKSNA
jgi:hypothetical protein